LYQADIEVGSNTQRQDAARVFQKGAAPEHACHKASRGNFADMVCAPDANGREGGFHAIGFLVHIPNGAGNGAKAALNQAHCGAVFLSRSRLIAVVADFEDGVCLQGNDGVISEAQLHIAVGTRCNRVTHKNVSSARQWTSGPVCSGSDLPCHFHYNSHYRCFFRRARDKWQERQA